MATTHRKGKRVVDPVPRWYDTLEAESIKLKNAVGLTSTRSDLLKMRSCMVSPMRPGASAKRWDVTCYNRNNKQSTDNFSGVASNKVFHYIYVPKKYRGDNVSHKNVRGGPFDDVNERRGKLFELASKSMAYSKHADAACITHEAHRFIKIVSN